MERINAAGGCHLRQSVRNPGGFIALPTEWDWCQIGRIGFNEKSVFGDQPNKLVVSPLLERHDAAEGDVPSGVDRERGERMCPGIAVQYALDSGSARVSDDCTSIVLGIPGVNNHGPAGFRGKRHLCGERVSLRLTRRVVVVVVETTLANGDGARSEKLAKLGDVPARIECRSVVGMDASRGENKTWILGRARGGDRRGID
jgi:hypothetical protein